MKRWTRKAAGSLSAGLLAVGLFIGMSPMAQASVNPIPGVYSELFMPYSWNGSYSECLDVPGETTAIVGLQIYHCHGYASNGAGQRWELLWFDSGYEIINSHSGKCIDYGGAGAQVVQNPCNGLRSQQWTFIQSVGLPDYVQLQNVDNPGFCMGLDWTLAETNQQPVTSGWCQFNDPGNEAAYDNQLWALG